MLADGDPDLFEMANLYPATTGLPMTVWVSPRGNASHDERVKVHTSHGNRMVPSNTAVMSIRPHPRLVEGALPIADRMAVTAWIAANAEALVDYWDGNIDTAQPIGRLVKV